MVSFNSIDWGNSNPWLMSQFGVSSMPPTYPPILAGIDQQFGLMPQQASWANPLLGTDFVPQFQQLGFLTDPYAMSNWQAPILGASYPQPGSVVDETLAFVQGLLAQSQAMPASPIRANAGGGVSQPQESQPSYSQPRPNTGEGRQDAVAWAQSQLGVSEEHNPNQVRQYSQGRWEAWCGDFVSTALEQTGGSPWGHRASVADIHGWASQNGRLTNTPKVGDAFIQSSNGKHYGHIGIIEEIKPDGTIIGIAGNTRDAVRRMTFRPGDPSLRGFVDTSNS